MRPSAVLALPPAERVFLTEALIAREQQGGHYGE